MAEYKWDKPIITVNEIMAGLISQYGPENKTRILMEDTNKPISYKASLLNCECLRCGKTFTATPSALLNGIYINGFVCTGCGMLSDEEVRTRKTEARRQAALEVLKESGQDVVKEAIDDMMDETKTKDAEKVVVDDDDGTYDESLEVMTAEDAVKIERQMSGEKDGNARNVAERSSESGTSSGNEESSDVARSIHAEPNQKDKDQSSGTRNGREDVQKSRDSRPEKATESVRSKQPELDNGKEMKQKAIKNSEASEDDYKKYMSDDDDFSSPINELLSDISKDDSGEEATVVDDDDESIFGVEEPTSEPEAEVSEESATSEAEPEVKETNKEVIEEKDDDSSSEPTDSELARSEEFEEDEEDRDGQVKVGKTWYDADELGEKLYELCKTSRDAIGINSWDTDTCESISGTNKISLKCKTCRKDIKSDDIEFYAIAKPLDELLELNGVTYNKNKENNIDGSVPIVNACPECLKSIIENGCNVYHKRSVISMAMKSHFYIKNADNHYFCRTPKEFYLVECNGVEQKMTFADMILHFGRGEDARLDALFKKVEEKPKAKLKISLTKKAEASEESLSAIDESEIEAAEVTEEVITSKSPAKRVITLKKNAPKQQNNAEEIKTEKSAKVTMTVTQQPQQKPISNPTNEPPKKFVLKMKPKPEAATQQKDAESVKGTNAQKAMNGAVFSASDSFETLDNERKMEREEMEKHNVFSVGAKFKRLNKSDAVLDGAINPFEREVDLTRSFENSCFYEFIEALSQKTEIDYTLIVNAKTYEIPVVDFECGVRLICADLNEPSLANMEYSWINPTFSYTNSITGKPKPFKWQVLFSDSIEYARDATFSALVKYINPKILPYGSKKVILQNNLAFSYTTNSQYLEDFDRRFSTYPSKKPATNRLGIIARWSSTKQATAKDVLKWRLQMEGYGSNVSNLDTLASDYEEYMVASIKYIETFNKETNNVLYTITDYVETGSSIVGDGFLQCLRALLKEHRIKYPMYSASAPYVVFEYDPNTLPSPSLKAYIERGTFKLVDAAINAVIEGSNHINTGIDKFFRYSMIRRPEYRDYNRSRDFMRQDLRMFEVGTIVHTMKDEISKAGLSNTIRNPEIRKQFIANMGYIKARQVDVRKYFINQLELLSLMNDGFTLNLPKHIEEDGFNQKTNMVMDSTAGIGLNNIMTNPAAMMRYQHIMNNGSSEAKDYFNRMMWDDQRRRMTEYVANMNSNAAAGNSNNGTGSVIGNVQQVPIGSMPFMQAPQFTPMGMPMNPMMGMGMPGMGMNPMMMGGMNACGMGTMPLA